MDVENQVKSRLRFNRAMTMMHVRPALIRMIQIRPILSVSWEPVAVMEKISRMTARS